MRSPDLAAPRTAAAPAAPLALTGTARLLRRTRHQVRRRVRVALEGLVDGRVTDGVLDLRLATTSPRDPRRIEWTADRPVALVVLHDGCGARVIGSGGVAGRLEIPSGTCPRAFLAFCYDAEAATADGGASPASASAA